MSRDHTEVPEAVVATEGDDMLNAVNRLSERVTALSENLTVSDQQARRTQTLSRIVIFMVIAGLVAGAWYVKQLSDATNANDASLAANAGTQIQQCENANSVRAANILLWDQITGLSIESPASTAEQRAAFIALQEWIRGLYRPRDCSNLDKVYDNPPPPDFNKIMGQDKKVSGNS